MRWQRFFIARPGTIVEKFVEQFRHQFCYLQELNVDLSTLPVTLPKGDFRFRPTVKAKISLFLWPFMTVLFAFAAYANSGSIIAWSAAIFMFLALPMFAYSFVANALMCRSLTFNKHDLHVREYDGTEWRASYRSYRGVRQHNFTRRGPKRERFRAIALVHDQRERGILLNLSHNLDDEPSPLADYARILDLPIIEAKAPLDEEQSEGWRSWLLPVVITLLILGVAQGGLYFWTSLQPKAYFVIQNHARSDIAHGKIKMGNRKHYIRPTAMGEQRTVTFLVSDGGEFSVVIDLANGRKLTVGPTGVLTPGKETQVTLDVRDDKIIVTETDF